MSLSGITGARTTVPDWSAVSRASSTSAPKNPKAIMEQLGADLKAGNLSAAQTDWQTMTAASGRAMHPHDADSFAQDMQGLGSALQSGDLTAAQAAFEKITTSLHTSGVHHHKPHPAAAPAQPATDATTDPFAQAFGQLGEALKSGDTEAAKKALEQLQQLLGAATTSLTDPNRTPGSVDFPPGARIDTTA